jgi:hypothetical protein
MASKKAKFGVRSILENVTIQIDNNEVVVNYMFDTQAQMMAIPAEENELCFCAETRSAYIYQFHNWALLIQIPFGVKPVYANEKQSKIVLSSNYLLNEDEFSLFKVNILNNKDEE